MWPFSRRVEDLSEADLRELIGVKENVALDFKGRAYVAPDQNLDLLRDVTSMANAEGGTIILGMEEDGEARATRLKPVERAEYESDRIRKLCERHISERMTCPRKTTAIQN